MDMGSLLGPELDAMLEPAMQLPKAAPTTTPNTHITTGMGTSMNTHTANTNTEASGAPLVCVVCKIRVVLLVHAFVSRSTTLLARFSHVLLVVRSCNRWQIEIAMCHKCVLTVPPNRGLWMQKML